MSTDVVQVFSNSRTFSPTFTDPAPVTNTDDVKAFGIQVIGNGVVLGQPIDATIQITTDGAIPEPSTLALGGLGMVAIAAAARRRR